MPRAYLPEPLDSSCHMLSVVLLLLYSPDKLFWQNNGFLLCQSAFKCHILTNPQSTVTLKKHAHRDLSQWSAFVLSSVTVFWLTFSCCDQIVTKRFLCLTHPDAEGSPSRSSSRSRGRTHPAYFLPSLCLAAFLIPSRTTCLWWAGTEPAPTPINNRHKNNHTDRLSGQSTKGNS